MGIDTTQFMKKLSKEEYKTATQQEFELVQKMGITGFPTVFVIRKGQGYLLSNGYMDYATLSKNLERIIAI